METQLQSYNGQAKTKIAFIFDKQLLETYFWQENVAEFADALLLIEGGIIYDFGDASRGKSLP